MLPPVQESEDTMFTPVYSVVRQVNEWKKCESGSVTTDWVLLIAGLLTLSFLVMSAIKPSTEELAEETGTALSARQPGQL